MGFTYNPFNGNLDIKGGGGGSGPAERHIQSFNNTTDWTLNGSVYELSVLQTTHGRGVNPTVFLVEAVGLDFEQVFADTISINASGDIVVKVLSTPDLRFNGKIIII